MMQEVLKRGDEQPNITVGILFSIFFIVLTIVVTTLSGGKEKPPVCLQSKLIYFVGPRHETCFKVLEFPCLYMQANVTQGKMGMAAAQTSNNQRSTKEKESETKKATATAAAPPRKKSTRRDA